MKVILTDAHLFLKMYYNTIYFKITLNHIAI